MTGAARTPEDYQIEDFVTDESFINYFFRLNAEDTGFWTKWLLAHPENAGLAASAKELLQSLSLTLPEEEFEAELARIRTAIHEETHPAAWESPAIVRLWPVQGVRRGSGRRRSRRRSLTYVGLFLLLLAGSTFLWRQFNAGPARLSEKTNDSSKPVVFTLTDGTVVTLAPHSVFRYPADFGVSDRKVFLDGEAQFQVSRDEARPFKVYEGDIMATVLGTVFQVKYQAADSVILVELMSGKLRVETIARPGLAAQSTLLDPDERALYRGNDRRLYKEKWQPQHDLSLPVNHLVFKGDGFEQIARQIKTVFGVTIINHSTKQNWRFTGDFTGAGVAEIVENICLVEGLHSERKGDTIIIR